MTNNSNLRVTFCGGAGMVTGANFLLTDGGLSGNKVLVDCGLIQGSRIAEEQNYAPFSYRPEEISVLLVTHAHLDHIGRIPKLIKDGFRGKIYSTAPTKEISELSLIDSLGVLSKEIRGSGKPLLYEQKDVALAMDLWQTLDYGESIELGEFLVTPRNAGHILGSAMFEFKHQPSNTNIVFTGDLGNSPAPLLPDTELIKQAHYLIMESVYGDRNHEDRSNRRDLLEDAIENTMHRGGTLVIPAFSIERTQEMLYEIEHMMESSRIPLVPVFIDSPLAINVTKIYKKYDHYLSHRVEPIIQGHDGIFSFPQLRPTLSTEASRDIASLPQRKIIIAGSGMSNGGRVIHHEKQYLPDPKNALLLVGYQVAGSLGRQILDGAKFVKILGEQVPVRAEIINISGYSAHKDYQGLMEFVRQTGDSLEKVFVVIGEPKSSLYLAQSLRDYLGVDAVVPKAGDVVEIPLN